jgi:hypothetical protein
MNNTIYHLQSPDDLKKLTNLLMRRSLQWSVMSDAQLTYPCHVLEVNDFSIQATMLREVIKHDGVWRSTDTTISQLRHPVATTPVNVVSA